MKSLFIIEKFQLGMRNVNDLFSVVINLNINTFNDRATVGIPAFSTIAVFVYINYHGPLLLSRNPCGSRVKIPKTRSNREASLAKRLDGFRIHLLNLFNLCGKIKLYEK